jgi:predicted methyltransferase
MHTNSGGKAREKQGKSEEYGKMQGVQQPGTIFDLFKNIKVYTKMFSNYEGASGTFLNL